MIQTINVITNNVSEELRKIAMQNSVSVSELYIKVNSVTTFANSSTSGLVEISDNTLNKYKDEKSLRDEKIEFNQEYDIDVQSIHKGYHFKDMNCQIEFDENETLAYFIINKGSNLKYFDGLFDGFINYIIEQQLRSNVMLYLFDTDYQETIKEFVNVIKKVKSITFKEDKKILVSKGMDVIKAITAKVIMNIEENSDVGNEDNEGKVDYANRGFFLSCAENEQLFEFIKPQQGQHGRTCRGEVIEVETISLDEKPLFTVDDSIEIQDSFENIKYLSNKSGFLIKTGEQYDVSSSIDIDEISFKTTGTINSNIDSEISINVAKDDPLEDAIEEGMHVKVRKLSVKGNVGPDTNIETRDIFIDGQTHGDSFIKCVNADIRQHRGKIIGREVKVKTLEGGEIIADKAIIENAIRGEIRAKVIEIGILSSHVKMEASEYIQVDLIKGEENKFIIDTSIVSAFDNNKENDTDYLNKMEEEFKLLLKTLRDTTEKVKKNLAPCEKIKATIIKHKNDGITITDSLIKNFKLCKIMRVRYKKLKEDVEHKKSQIQQLKSELVNTSVGIYDTKVIVKKPIKGYNNIIYRIKKPKMEINLKTDEMTNKTTFKLIEDDEGVLKIINTD